MNKEIFIVANWKCNKSPDEAIDFIEQMKEIENSVPEENTVVICPSMLSVDRVANELSETKFFTGVQNFFSYLGGAYTGEIAVEQISTLPVDFAIVGHSERRAYFNETDEIVNAKIKMALSDGIVPIVCVGETLEEREAEQTTQIIMEQVRNAIKDIPVEIVNEIIWAYEPLWAIGTGKTATPDDADKVCHLIKDTVAEETGVKIQELTVLYGGSVKAKNFYDYVSSVSIDGILVGGASLDFEQFKEMITRRVVSLKAIKNQPNKRLANR